MRIFNPRPVLIHNMGKVACVAWRFCRAHYGAEKTQKCTQSSRTSGEANLLEASLLSPILACLHARRKPPCYRKLRERSLFYGRRYDLPKVRHRSTGLRCIDDNAKQKMFQLCEELTAYDTCTESRFFVVTLCLITDELTHERETIIVQRTDFVRFCRSFCLKKPTEKLPSFSSNFT